MFKWIKRKYNHFRRVLIVKDIYKKNQAYFNQYNIKMDWIGRFYTVINRDPQFKIGSDEDKSLLKDETILLGSIFRAFGIDTILSIKLTPILSETENAYLVVLECI